MSEQRPDRDLLRQIVERNGAYAVLTWLADIVADIGRQRGNTEMAQRVAASITRARDAT